MNRKLSIDDKMHLLTGKGMWHTDSLDGKIPQVFMSDGPHGLRAQSEKAKTNNMSIEATCFPTASALAASWDKEIVAEAAGAIADEAKNAGTSILLGPGINMKRSPSCGRNFEYFSEDPFLAGELAASFICAVEEKGVGTSLKHFAVNSQETHRMRENNQVDTRTLREIYLPAFETAVKKGKPATVMASYNRINGEYACANKELLTDILRNEWGYEGAVISDWGACIDLPKCVKAGMDLEMPESCGMHYEQLKQAFESGKITIEEIDAAVERVLKLIDKYPGKEPALGYDKKGGLLQDKELLKINHEKAKKCAEECAVLLKNDGILPLAKGKEYILIGGMAKQVRFQGGGSSHINTYSCKSYIDALYEKCVVNYAQGYDQESNETDRRLFDEAVCLVKEKHFPVIFVGGLNDLTEGEGFDRESFDMPQNQKELLAVLSEYTKDIIYISVSGSPYDMQPAENARAILHMYLGGESVAEAAAELLFGDAVPCGKLAETFPYRYEDTPAYGNFATGSDDVCYLESIYVGYRYYDTFKVPVRYPFGYGLSYTTFDYTGLTVRDNGSDENGRIRLMVDISVTNSGSMTGKEIAELYVRNPKGRIARPEKELRGFVKLELAPGETRTGTVELTERSFSMYDVEKQAYVVPDGAYELLIGVSSADVRLVGTVHIENGAVVKLKNTVENHVPIVDTSEYEQPHIMSFEEFRKVYGKNFSTFTNPQIGKYDMSNSLAQLSKVSPKARAVMKLANTGAAVLFIGKRKDDPEVRMVTETIADGSLDAVVNQSNGLIKPRTAKQIIDEANGRR